jgi:beta-glucosidase
MKRFFLSVFCALMISAFAFPQQGVITPEIVKRAETIVRQMTLEEKIDYISGYNDFCIRAVPRLGIPEIRMADGPQGIRNNTQSTLFPCGILSASTWNRELIYRLGIGLGEDARARGVHILLGPGVNIYRSPFSGRNYEYFGEDPYLAGEIAVQYIKGVQSQGVVATVKHLAGNNQEWNRHHVSSDIDERTLHEIYLPAFKKAIDKANVGAVMGSYNLLNSVHTSENRSLNIDILRRQWGFKGILMSDFNSVYSGVAAANSGLDLEMRSGRFMNREILLPAIASGIVTEKSIDQKVQHILQVILAYGFSDREQKDPSIPEDNPHSCQTALNLAREGIVLLKNDNNILPLKTKNILVLGPNADKIPTGGGSGFVNSFHTVSVLEGFRQLAGKKYNIDYIREGAYIPASVSTEINGEPVSSEDLTEGDFTVCWNGTYCPAKSGITTFYLNGNAFRLYVDDNEVLHWSKHTVSYKEASIMVHAGKSYKLRVEYYKTAPKTEMELKYRFFDPNNATFLNQLKKADAVVICVGFNSDIEKENSDRTFALPEFQEQYIDLITRNNPNAIVVVNAGGGVDVSSWEKQVKAILMAWYPGQQGGTAIAEILTGKISPTGKLPISIEKKWEDNPVFNSYYPVSDLRFNTRNSPYLRVQYTEGVFMGYRGYNKSQVEPRFPFGFGLSYTSFEYSDFNIRKTGNISAQVSFNLKNTGDYDAAEIVQVYVGDVKASVPRPLKELKGFGKIFLKKGESRKINIDLDEEAFSFYDVDTQQFIIEPGEFEIQVASSSSEKDLKWKTILKL